MPPILFYVLAAITILAALAVILARNPMYNVLSLVVVIFSLASLFIGLEAFFVGVILCLVYAGAVLIFFLFIVMCLNLTKIELPNQQQTSINMLGWFAGIMFALNVFLITKSYVTVTSLPASSIRGTIEAIGERLFTDYLLPFELTSFLLLIAIFGIVSLAKGVFKS